MPSSVQRLAAAVLVLGAVPARGGDLPADLAAAVTAYDRATVHSDIPALERLVAEDYVLVNSDASVEDKRQYLADFNLPGFKIDPYVREQPIEKVWGDAAVVGGVVHLSWTQDGKHRSAGVANRICVGEKGWEVADDVHAGHADRNELGSLPSFRGYGSVCECEFQRGSDDLRVCRFKFDQRASLRAPGACRSFE